MKVLGYCGGLDGYPSRFGTSHDAAAAVVVDGRVVAACEEERFTRAKHTGKFPKNALDYCLRAAGLATAAEATLVCYYHVLSQMFRPEMLEANQASMSPRTRLAFRAGLGFMRGYNRLFGYDEERSWSVFKKHTGILLEPGRFRAVPHHLCHAASAFFPSPFEEALVLTLDAQGESASAMLAIGRGNEIRPLRQLFAPNSVGYLYTVITRYLGFGVGDDYKVMGLAPYGDPGRFRAYFSRMVQTDADGSFRIDADWLSPLIVRDALFPDGALYPRSMRDSLGPPRRPDDPLVQRHADIAAALQEALERVVLRMIEAARLSTGQRHLCLAGGVALNCTMNGKIARSGLFERVWVQPAAHDAGTSLGAALYGYHVLLGAARNPEPRAPMYLGPEHRSASLSRALLELGPHIRCQRSVDVVAVAARALADGKIVGWFQGRSEWGPRALGHRSILADPRRADTRERVNGAVKLREGFRPFAPACPREQAPDWFDLTGVGESPYMLFTVPVLEGRRGQIPAVTHVDGTARVQTVDRADNPRFHALLRAFQELTGVPVLLNTSFNVNGEPIVQTPDDAIRCFLATKLDLLVIGDTIIEKRAAAEKHAEGPAATAAAH